MFAPAACAVRPLWKLTEPARIGAATGSMPASSGYSLKRAPISGPIGALSKVVSLWLPGRKYRQPFCIVASASAIHTEIASRLEKDQYGTSRCQLVGLAQG